MVVTWNSPNCGLYRFTEFGSVTAPVGNRITGTRWNVTYRGETIAVTVIDHVEAGTYNLSEEDIGTVACVIFLSSFSPKSSRRCGL